MACEDFAALAGRCTVPDYSDLRPARRAKNITLTTTAAALDVWPARVGELERGQLRNDDLATDCRTWLSAA